MKKEPPVSFYLRLPPALHAALKHLAEEDDRSLNWMMVHLLQEAVRRRTKGSGAEPPAGE